MVCGAVPLKFMVLPVPGINDALDTLFVILPAIFRVLAKLVALLILNAVVPPPLEMVRFPLMVRMLDALVNVIVAIRCMLFPPVRDTFCKTVTAKAPMESLEFAFAAGAVTFRLLQTASAAFTVTWNPPSITTSLQEVGTEAPEAPPDEVDQVDVLFQSPLAIE